MANTGVMDLWAKLLTVKVPTKKHEFTCLAVNSASCTRKAIYGSNFISNEVASQYFSCWHTRQRFLSSCRNGSPLALALAYVLA